MFSALPVEIWQEIVLAIPFQARSHHPITSRRSLLSKVSLVHSSVTERAQRLLWSELEPTSTAELEAILSSPAIGKHKTKTVRLRGSGLAPAYSSESNVVAKDGPRWAGLQADSVYKLLERLRGIEVFELSDLYPTDGPGFSPLMLTLPSLISLNSLILVRTAFAPLDPFYDELPFVLTSLHISPLPGMTPHIPALFSALSSTLSLTLESSPGGSDARQIFESLALIGSYVHELNLLDMHDPVIYISSFFPKCVNLKRIGLRSVASLEYVLGCIPSGVEEISAPLYSDTLISVYPRGSELASESFAIPTLRRHWGHMPRLKKIELFYSGEQEQSNSIEELEYRDEGFVEEARTRRVEVRLVLRV